MLAVSLRARLQRPVYLSQQHEWVQLAPSETGGAELRASTFRLDSSFCCSWKARRQRQKTEQTLLLLWFCHLSLTHSVLHPPALPASFFPSSCRVSLPHFLLSCLSLSHLMLPPTQPFLSAVAAHHFLPLTLSVFALCSRESGTIRGRAPFVEFRQVWELPGGSLGSSSTAARLRGGEKDLPHSRWRYALYFDNICECTNDS